MSARSHRPRIVRRRHRRTQPARLGRAARALRRALPRRARRLDGRRRAAVDPAPTSTCRPSSLQWVVSAYVLGYGGFLLLGGRAADLLGRRRVFLISLGVFVVASVLGGLADDGTLLIATRFIKGVSAAFTAPAGAVDHHHDLRRGPGAQQGARRSTPRPARPGFSLGLVFGGLLTEIGWRWVFFLPGARRARRADRRRSRLVPDSEPLRPHRAARFDVAGAVTHDGRDAAARLHARRGARRRLGLARGRSARSPASPRSCAAFVAREQRTRRRRSCGSASCARARSCARTSARCRCSAAGSASSSSPRCTCSSCAAGRRSRPGSRSSPAGLLVALVSPRIAPLIVRFGVTRLIVAGHGLDRGRLRAVPADRARLELRVGDAADVPARRPRLRARLRAAQHRGDERHRAARSRASRAGC